MRELFDVLDGAHKLYTRKPGPGRLGLRLRSGDGYQPPLRRDGAFALHACGIDVFDDLQIEVGRHHLRARQLLDAVDQSRPAADLDIGAHAPKYGRAFLNTLRRDVRIDIAAAEKYRGTRELSSFRPGGPWRPD